MEVKNHDSFVRLSTKYGYVFISDDSGSLEVKIDSNSTPFERVKAFHRKFGLHPLGSEFTPEVVEYRVDFLKEELKELIVAYAKDDKEGVLDALVDLVYVAMGTADLHGYDFDEAFRRVHAANMQKQRAGTAEHSKRRTALDVIKPAGWQAPDLSDLVTG